MARPSSRSLNLRKRKALAEIPLRLQYSIPEAAFLLGTGQRTLWRMIRAKQLSAVHLGARVFIARSTLEKIISDNTDTSGAPVRQAPPHIAAKVAAAAARASA